MRPLLLCAWSIAVLAGLAASLLAVMRFSARLQEAERQVGLLRSEIGRQSQRWLDLERLNRRLGSIEDQLALLATRAPMDQTETAAVEHTTPEEEAVALATASVDVPDGNVRAREVANWSTDQLASFLSEHKGLDVDAPSARVALAGVLARHRARIAEVQAKRTHLLDEISDTLEAQGRGELPENGRFGPFERGDASDLVVAVTRTRPDGSTPRRYIVRASEFPDLLQFEDDFKAAFEDLVEEAARTLAGPR